MARIKGIESTATTATITLDTGAEVLVSFSKDGEVTVVELDSTTHDLEGDEPGRYAMVN